MLLLALLACTDPKTDTADDAPARFPAGFHWGSAVAGFQVEAGCPTVPASECTDDASDWYQWVSDPALVAEGANHLSGQPIEAAPGHYELYPQDLALARGLGHTAFRTSLEWSRLFPDGAAEGATTVEELRAHADPVAVAHYRAYLEAVRAAGLEPYVTLTHYTLPLWIHDGKACHEDLESCEDRGWVDLERMRRAIALYSAFCAETYGDVVDAWITENEPLAIVLAGYLLPGEDRTNPPGIRSAPTAFQVFFNLVEGHAAMYDAVKAHDGVDADGDGAASAVGLAANLAAVAPLDPENPDDVRGAEHADYVYNRLFLEGIVRGALDRDVDGVAEEQRPDLAGRLDWLGINYYTRITVRGLQGPIFPGYPRFDFFPEVLWEEYPEGLAEVVAIGQSYDLPIVITENGTTPTDTSAETFLRPHLDSLLGAIEGGADVRGYLYWSLMDNYEWNHGMDLRFGLYEVDPATKARSERPIAAAYREIVAAGTPR
jgi:beta-glucosidase/6-phospho-beta-glucosidase/beta-galactosidase